MWVSQTKPQIFVSWSSLCVYIPFEETACCSQSFYYDIRWWNGWLILNEVVKRASGGTGDWSWMRWWIQQLVELMTDLEWGCEKSNWWNWWLILNEVVKRATGGTDDWSWMRLWKEQPHDCPPTLQGWWQACTLKEKACGWLPDIFSM